MEQLVIIKQIVMLTMLGLTGFIAGKTGYLPENAGVVLSRIVIKLTAPLLIVTTMANHKFSRNDFNNGIIIYFCALVFLVFAFVLSHLTSSRLGLSDAAGNIYRMQSVFGNVIFLAYPLLDALFGNIGLIYGIFFNLANDSLLWTLGIYLVNKHNTTRWQDNLKHLVNGNTIAFAAGVFFIIINLRKFVETSSLAKNIYTLAYDTFNPLGRTTIYLSMLFIGLILSEVKIGSASEFLRRYPLFVLSFFKLLLVPIIALIVLSNPIFKIDPIVKAIIVLQLAMPSATIVPALASQYDSDYRFATECVFITTVIGVFTLPVMASVISVFCR